MYYPESVVDEVSLMEFLYRQAKDYEDKERWAKEQDERDAQVIRGRTKKKQKKHKPFKQPAYIAELAHTNQQAREMTM